MGYDVRWHLFSHSWRLTYACMACEVSWPFEDGGVTCWGCGGEGITYRDFEEMRVAARQAAVPVTPGCPCVDCTTEENLPREEPADG